MRLLKPMRMSITQRVITMKREHRLTVGLLVYFPFSAPEVPLHEIKMWSQLAETVLADGSVLDECLPKARGEVLLFGKAYAARGEPVPLFRARMAVGPIDKGIAVFGRRYWTARGPSQPEPFTELDLSWSNAFGGSKFVLNPKGMGIDEVVEQDGQARRLLPRLEYPKMLIASRDDQPAPACFGPLDLQLEQRMALMGTYGPDYLQTDFPGFARDMHPDFFQTAPADQRLQGYFQGGEPIELENLHATERKLVTHVPRLRGRLFIQQVDENGQEEMHEVATRMDTVVLLPNVQRGVAIFRGVHPVREDDAKDVTVIGAGIESLDAPRPASHYRGAFERRLDPERGHFHMLRDKELVPEPQPGAPSFDDEDHSDMDQLLDRKNRLMERSRTRAKRELDNMRLVMHVLGLDPDEHLPPAIEEPVVAPKLDDLAEFMDDVDAKTAEMQAKGEQLREEAETQMREACEAIGLDFDEVVENAKKSGGGPPPFRAETELQQLRDLAEVGRKAGAPIVELEAKIADPEFVAKLEMAEAGLLAGYRLGAHLMPAAKPATDEVQQRATVVVQACLDSGEPLRRHDLTGIDLRGFDLSGVDLSEALLEGADLRGVNLRGANLEGAVLARALLSEADLSNAKLGDANLGEAHAENAVFRGADLAKAIMHFSKLAGADLSGAVLDNGRILESDLSGANLSDMQAEAVMLFRCNFTGATLARSRLFRTMFVFCDVTNVDFTDAYLERTTFMETPAEGVCWHGANATACAVIKSSMKSARLAGATLERLNVRGVDLTAADLSGARADGADFSEANLTKANLRGLRANGALFIRTNMTDADVRDADLMEALFMKTTLDRTRFDGANLFRASLLGAEGNDTSFAGCFVKRVLFNEDSA